MIKPLAPRRAADRLAAARYVGETRSRVLLNGMHTCANCHSFSRDGKTLGMDLDGPKTTRACTRWLPFKPQMSIRNET